MDRAARCQHWLLYCHRALPVHHRNHYCPLDMVDRSQHFNKPAQIVSRRGHHPGRIEPVRLQVLQLLLPFGRTVSGETRDHG